MKKKEKKNMIAWKKVFFFNVYLFV